MRIKLPFDRGPALALTALFLCECLPGLSAADDGSRHLKLGKPQAVHERVREGYALAEDSRLKIPVWVQYELRPEDLEKKVDRNSRFRADPTIPAGSRAEDPDYAKSGYDRGHMAPANDMKRSQSVMDECFLLSNIAPQVGRGFNQGIWRILEADVQKWVRERGALTIIMGPVFEAAGRVVSYPVIGRDEVAVPTHFFKIIVDANDPGNIQALAFLMPNADLTGRDAGEFLVAIDEIERLTGLDLLSALSPGRQAEVESRKAASVWP